MTDEQAARSKLWGQIGLFRMDIAESLDTYRDAIVAATVAEYEGKLAALEGHIWTVRDAFDSGLFVRTVKGDSSDDWAVKFLGPLGALAQLYQFVDARDAARTPSPEGGI